MYKIISMSYDEKSGRSSIMVDYRGIPVAAYAYCHPDDQDFGSERVGLAIAEARVLIEVLQFKRDYEIKPQLKVLQHLYTNMKTSKHFNPKSYEAKMVRSQIHAIENELAAVNNDLVEERKSLKEYIDSKDKLYKKLRAKHQ